MSLTKQNENESRDETFLMPDWTPLHGPLIQSEELTCSFEEEILDTPQQELNLDGLLKRMVTKLNRNEETLKHVSDHYINRNEAFQNAIKYLTDIQIKASLREQQY